LSNIKTSDGNGQGSPALSLTSSLVGAGSGHPKPDAFFAKKKLKYYVEGSLRKIKDLNELMELMRGVYIQL